jgi:hypothetical protein
MQKLIIKNFGPLEDVELDLVSSTYLQKELESSNDIIQSFINEMGK